MGKFGDFITRMGQDAGRTVGGFVDRATGNTEGRGARLGADLGQIGSEFGKYIPFKKGGRVHKTGPALVHKGEFILPKGVPPTKAQLMKVRQKKGLGMRKKSKGRKSR